MVLKSSYYNYAERCNEKFIIRDESIESLRREIEKKTVKKETNGNSRTKN